MSFMEAFKRTNMNTSEPELLLELSRYLIHGTIPESHKNPINHFLRYIIRIFSKHEVR